MLRRTEPAHFTSGAKRPYLTEDKTLKRLRTGRSGWSLKQQFSLGYNMYNPTKREKFELDQAPYTHAFPLLNHTDFGKNEQFTDTKLHELANYMPKRSKGLPPWFRGANTYSPLYAEQGRYEFMRYLMIARPPQEHKDTFNTVLANIRAGLQRKDPNEALHYLYKLLVEHYNPQHVHYETALKGLVGLGELSRARDVWRIMERQQTWPDDKCVAAYLDLCRAARQKEWAFECWNRYCTEKRFLQDGEADPKPISRVPFTLNRDETLYLPKWKKFFDHDPNLDVADRNRFNTTRALFLGMARTMLATGEYALFEEFFGGLEEGLMTTPTPVPEPPAAVQSDEREAWLPRWDQDRVTSANPFTIDRETAKNALGPEHTRVALMDARFFSNRQFYLHAVGAVLDDLIAAHQSGKLPANMSVEVMKSFAAELLERAWTKTGDRIAELRTEALFLSVLRFHRVVLQKSGADLHQLAKELQRRKAAAVAGGDTATTEPLHEAHYLEVLRAFNDTAARQLNQPGFDARATARAAWRVAEEMNGRASLEWSSDHHFEIVRMLVLCGTMKANEYFAKNVMRRFVWSSRFFLELYQEYRRHADVEMWAELTKRMLVWSARYDVEVDEATKRAIEDDYDTIGVQVRTLRELVIFSFRNVEEKRLANDPATLMPNPVQDYVSHALAFPDRDTGAINEYGATGQMRDPKSPVKGMPFYFPALEDVEAQRGYTAEWTNPNSPNQPTRAMKPFDKKNVEYLHGRHPSYDQVYAGPFPEIMPGPRNWRQTTRWDFKDIENQSKYKMANPY